MPYKKIDTINVLKNYALNCITTNHISLNLHMDHSNLEVTCFMSQDGEVLSMHCGSREPTTTNASIELRDHSILCCLEISKEFALKCLHCGDRMMSNITLLLTHRSNYMNSKINEIVNDMLAKEDEEDEDPFLMLGTSAYDKHKRTMQACIKFVEQFEHKTLPAIIVAETNGCIISDHKTKKSTVLVHKNIIEKYKTLATLFLDKNDFDPEQCLEKSTCDDIKSIFVPHGCYNAPYIADDDIIPRFVTPTHTIIVNT